MSKATATEQDPKHFRPIMALGFDNDNLMLISAAPGQPYGVHAAILLLDGLCDELTRSSAYRRPHDLRLVRETPASVSAIGWYEYGNSGDHTTYRMGFTSTDGEDYTLEAGPLICEIRHEATPGVYERPTMRGVKVQLERLHIEYGPGGTPNVQLMSEFVKSRRRQPLNVLIGNDDRVMLIMRDPRSHNGLVVVDTNIPGAHQHHADRLTGQIPVHIALKARDYIEYRVPEASIRGGVKLDCNWTVGNVMHQLHGVGYPISTYVPEPDKSGIKLTMSNPEWVDVVRNGNDLLIGFTLFSEQD